METWVALVGGIIIGWVVEWVVDWLYWRRGAAAYYAAEAELRSQMAGLAAENESLRQQLAAGKSGDEQKQAAARQAAH